MRVIKGRRLLVGHHQAALGNLGCWNCPTAVRICILLCALCTFVYIPIFYTMSVQEDRNFTWNANSTRDLAVYVQPENVTAIIPNERFCAVNDQKIESPPLLLIVVCSAVGNFKEREAIRQTWLSQLEPNETKPFVVRGAFLLGETANDTWQGEVLSESNTYGDIIQEGFYDTYLNLTLKSVMMLKWTRTYCPQVTFVLKTDDDMYVNIPALVKYLSQEEVKQRKDLIVGSLFCRVVPINDFNSKWYSPKFMYSAKTYPDYVSGTGYVISGPLIGKLLEAALQVPLFHLEDVFTTGLVAQKVGIVPENYNLFSYLKHETDNYCLYRHIITSHSLSPDELRTVWRGVHDENLNCSAAKIPKIGDIKLKKCRKNVVRARAIRRPPIRSG